MSITCSSAVYWQSCATWNEKVLSTEMLGDVKIKSYVAVSFNEYGTSWQFSPVCWARDWTSVTESSWQRRRGRSVYETKPTFSEGLERDRHFLSSISDVPQSMKRNIFQQEYYTCNLFKKKVKQDPMTTDQSMWTVSWGTYCMKFISWN